MALNQTSKKTKSKPKLGLVFIICYIWLILISNINNVSSIVKPMDSCLILYYYIQSTHSGAIPWNMEGQALNPNPSTGKVFKILDNLSLT